MTELVFKDHTLALEELARHSRADLKKVVLFDEKMGRTVKWKIIPRNRDKVTPCPDALPAGSQ
jgi:hypothetical protein